MYLQMHVDAVLHAGLDINFFAH